MAYRRRRFRPRRRAMRKPRVNRRRMLRRPGAGGSVYLTRKTALVSIYNASGIPGVWNVNDPTGNLLQLGTPVAIPGTTNCYDTPFSMKFTLNQLMNATDITNLCDRYRIVKAKVRVHCNFNQAGGANAPTTTPWIEHYVDHDDAVVPSIANVRERMNVKTKFFGSNKPYVSILCRSRFADTIFRAGIASAYGVGSRREYINATYPDVEHYGIKGILHNVPLQGITGGGSLFDFDVQLAVVAKDLQ